MPQGVATCSLLHRAVRFVAEFCALDLCACVCLVTTRMQHRVDCSWRFGGQCWCRWLYVFLTLPKPACVLVVVHQQWHNTVVHPMTAGYMTGGRVWVQRCVHEGSHGQGLSQVLGLAVYSTCNRLQHCLPTHLPSVCVGACCACNSAI